MSPDLERLIGRAIVDKDFRDKLLANPEDAIRDAGLTLAHDEMDSVKKGISKMKTNIASQHLDQSLGMGLLGGWK
jgi:hypothetical protein